MVCVYHQGDTCMLVHNLTGTPKHRRIKSNFCNRKQIYEKSPGKVIFFLFKIAKLLNCMQWKFCEINSLIKNLFFIWSLCAYIKRSWTLWESCNKKKRITRLFPRRLFLCPFRQTIVVSNIAGFIRWSEVTCSQLFGLTELAAKKAQKMKLDLKK